MDEKTFTNLMTFWRAVEALSPQSLPKKQPSDKHEPTRDWALGTNPPWLDSGFKKRSILPSKAWLHNVYAATYERSRFIELLEQRLGNKPGVSEERPDGQSCVFSIVFDEHGLPLVDSLMISMAAWAFGVIEVHGISGLTNSDACDTSELHVPDGALDIPPSDSGFPGFDLQLNRLREELAWRLGHLPAGRPVDRLWLSDFTELVIDKLRLTNLVGADSSHRVKSVQVHRREKENLEIRSRSGDDFLNSFFIKDLNRLIATRLATTSGGLQHFLEPAPQRIKTDIRKDRDRALDLLRPQNFPEGSWPSEYPLVWSQQVAVNAMWKEFAGSDGIFAVNGPPGTGKTTLLRDVVAAIVVERAKLLVDRGSNLFGSRNELDVGNRTIPYYNLDQVLSGFSIVVASSNNGAVENVSLELPKTGAIHDIWSGSVDVYSDIAGALITEPAWAMVAGRLGNMENRNGFVETFWWPKSNEGKVPGLQERLNAIRKGKSRPGIPWKEAVGKFNQALAAEQDWRTRLVEIHGLPTRIATIEKSKVEANAERAYAITEQAALHEKDHSFVERIADAEEAIKRLHQRIALLKDTKPGFLEWLSTFGKSHRLWLADMRSAINELKELESTESTFQKQHRTVKSTQEDLKRRLVKINAHLQDLAGKLVTAEADLDTAKALLTRYWPDVTASEDEQERSSPWAINEWRAARIRVFIAAMNLHRAFVEENAEKMYSNIAMAMDMLKGKIQDPAARVIALDSLAVVCPVVSTAFGSVANLFGDLGAKSIGWLFIDEAGQATPQSAIGAIWRAQRIIVVGDPLQLEPVITLPRAIETSLAAHNGDVDRRWHPSRTSVQVLADQATVIGTEIGNADDSKWGGAPLRVHRRCDNPMLSVSNAIAYQGRMIHDKIPAHISWPISDWIDVPKSVASGNWISAEGDALREVLKDLLRSYQVPARSIFLISPFRDVARELRVIADSYGLNRQKVGTIHTAQGKEADVVIVVLGGGSAGARNWAALKPNLLNVAVSRAKTRLYVIGDLEDWSKREYFDVLAKEIADFKGHVS